MLMKGMYAIMTKIESTRLAEMSVAQWQDFIAGCAERVTSSPYSANYGNEVRSIVRQFMTELPIEQVWLIELNIGLCLLRKQSTSRHSGYFAQLAATETIFEIKSQLDNDIPSGIKTGQMERLLETAAYIRETALTDEFAPPSYLDIYVELWVSLLSLGTDGQRLFKDELAHLSKKARKGNELFPIVARAWMHFWLEEDREAWLLLESAERHRLKPAQVLRFLQFLEDTGNWNRLEAWLSHCATERVGHSPGSLDEYGRYWKAVVERLPEAEAAMWSAITSLLPSSRSLYEDNLMRFGHFRQWIDYQLSLGSDPLEFRAKDLQPIEKAAPEVLLPFYHQGAEKYVTLKNRDGYKRAIKLLKRLAKLYKKLKREERWEAYIEAFAGRHSRLRALQEELRKGGLIP